MSPAMKSIDVTTLSSKEMYFLLTSLVVPRPIAWVSTVDSKGRSNLAPFSYFNGVCSDPPLISISIADHGDGPKDTFRAIEETGVFCINLVEEELVQAMHQSSGNYAPEVSEFDVANLKTAPCAAIEGLRVAEARAALECKKVDVHHYGNQKKVHLVIGEIVKVHLDVAIAREDKPMADAERMNPVARLGGGHYAFLKEPFRLEAVHIPSSDVRVGA